MKRIALGSIVLLAVTLASFAATVHVAGGSTRTPIASAPGPHALRAKKAGPPTAAEFASVFVDATNRFAAEHNDPKRIGQADCVQASPGRYMCSYAVSRTGAPRECHVMQARWTPRSASTITVTLAGPTARCGSLREAIASLE